ncbi:MAG: hypothetical protein HZB26_19365 [Candidatus Hydrogenedentes bacterium]|nr:hypothetical protein [Candidatus Hydrogenedentota bacterium]
MNAYLIERTERSSDHSAQGADGVIASSEPSVLPTDRTLTKTLLGVIVPICSSCHRVRDDGGNWKALANRPRGDSLTALSHSICPDCMRLLYPNFIRDGDGVHDRDPRASAR